MGDRWVGAKRLYHKVSGVWTLGYLQERIVDFQLVPSTFVSSYHWCGYLNDDGIKGSMTPNNYDGLLIRECLTVLENPVSLQLGFYGPTLLTNLTHVKVGELEKVALSSSSVRFDGLWSQHYFNDGVTDFYHYLLARQGQPVPIKLYFNE